MTTTTAATATPNPENPTATEEIAGTVPATPDTATTATGATATDSPTPDATSDDGDQRGGNAEAAKYRVRLREAEAERDTLTARLAAAEQTVIDHAIRTAGIDPRLWAVSAVDLDTLRTETGQLDITAVLEQAKQIRTEIYGTGVTMTPNPQQGIPSQGPARSGLAEAFDPNNRR